MWGGEEGLAKARGRPGGRDPILNWAWGGGEPHKLLDRPPYHANCRCTVATVVRRGSLWEVSKTHPRGVWPCESCAAKERIWKWVAQRCHPALKVAKLPYKPESAAVVEALGYLTELMERYPLGVPRGGITVSFPEGWADVRYADWDKAQHHLKLSARYFGTQAGLQELAVRLRVLERTGQSPRGCHSPEYIIAHEFGHCLRQRLDGVKYAKWAMQEGAKRLCLRAAESVSEAFAEGFAVIEEGAADTWPDAVRQLSGMLREDGVM